MPTRKPSSASPKRSNSTSKPKHSAAGRRLIKAAKEMLAHAKGEISLPMRIYHAPDEIDVREIRQRTGLSQAGFARRYALSSRAVQEWEQGRRRPEPAVRAYLTVIRHDPDAVVRALRAESAAGA
jgi:putative transcriptional regulator